MSVQGGVRSGEIGYRVMEGEIHSVVYSFKLRSLCLLHLLE